MDVTEERMVMVVRLVQPTKACSPMDVTEEGMMMVARPVQSWKASPRARVRLLLLHWALFVAC